MTKRTRPDGPCRTKATYDHKRPQHNPPSPARQKVELEEKVREESMNRAFHKKVNAVGLAHVLFPDKVPPREAIKRRI
jgi:hypothetical protein